MIQTVKLNDEIMTWLLENRYVHLNILNHLRQHEDADILIHDSGIEQGIIVRREVDWDDTRLAFLAATTNKAFITEFWEMLPEGGAFFSAAPVEFARILAEIKEPRWYGTPCKSYAVKRELFVPVKPTNPAHAVGSLSPTDAEEIEPFHPLHGDERTPEVIAERIKWIGEDIAGNDTAALRVDGVLACWCLDHDDGSLGPLYTKEEFRRQGLAEIVAADLIEKQFARGLTPFVHIYENNANSLGLAAKVRGFEFTHECVWLGMEKS